jgi:hypothetical protein
MFSFNSSAKALYVKSRREDVDEGLQIQVAFLVVIETVEKSDLQTQKELVSRVVASNVICKSARLRDLFLYLCNRVLDESVDDIHELELGHKVFGRPEHYDTATDNIVRVHASLLRKRLAEHFQTEGINEPLIIEIPRGNYAPVFRKRDRIPIVNDLREPHEAPVSLSLPISLEGEATPMHLSPNLSSNQRTEMPVWKFRVASFLALGFACLSVILLVRSLNQRTHGTRASLSSDPAVRQFWSGVFQQDASTQVVLDDASLDFYEEATGHPIALAEYFDRSYLHPAEEAAAAKRLDPGFVHAFLLRRQSNFAGVALVSRLTQTAGALGSTANVQFARDFSFRQVKSGNIVLLGTRQSNPWIQPFDSSLALRWKFDPALGINYPIDRTAGSAELNKFQPDAEGSSHDGYAGIAFLPNLGGTGSVLIISGSGGAALGVALDFLNEESSMSQLRARLNPKAKDVFPYFEVLLKVAKGGSLPKFTTIVLCRSPQPIPQDVQTVSAELHR